MAVFLLDLEIFFCEWAFLGDFAGALAGFV
jgi:hypothetical protein